jgi:hypothetical protein
MCVDLWGDELCQAEHGLIGTLIGKAKDGGHNPEEIRSRLLAHLVAFDFPPTPASMNKRWAQLSSQVIALSPAQKRQAVQQLDRMRATDQLNQLRNRP